MDKLAERREKAKLRGRRLRAERKVKNLCFSCGSPNNPPYRQCDRCRSRSRGRYKHKRGPFVDPVTRFWQYVDKDSSGCWLWTGHRLPTGYGVFSYQGRPVGAHRLSWRFTYGEIPSGMFVCHHCDNPPCVRLDHLFVGTAADNTMDMMKKGRQNPGRKIGLKPLSSGRAQPAPKKGAHT